MINEESKQHWIRVGVIALITFLVSYLAFCLALKHHLKKAYNPFYQAEKMEKMLEKQAYDFDNYMLKKMENPFEPKMRPTMINLVKEPSEYKVIVDLAQLDGDESAIKVDVQGNELTVKGQFDKKIRGSEKIINFTQTYYLDEKLEGTKITKENRGNKYIVTIPFVSEDNDD